MKSATMRKVPEDFDARLNNASAVIFAAIKKRAINSSCEMMQRAGDQDYYFVDHTIQHPYQSLSGKPQMGVVTSVNLPKRDRIVQDVYKTLLIMQKEDEALKCLCEMYQQVKSIKRMSKKVQQYKSLMAIRSTLNQLVSGANCSF